MSILSTLRLGENVTERLCRPAWNSKNNFEAHKHRWDKHLRRFFYDHSHGLAEKASKNVTHRGIL